MDGSERKTSEEVSESMFPNVRKTFWRSASWNAYSGRRSAGDQPLSPTSGGSSSFPFADAFGSDSNVKGVHMPLTPRGQQCCKSRPALPALQPLAITRRSVDDWSRAPDDGGEWTPPVTPNRKKDGNRLRNGPDIKLDIGAVQRARDASEPTETQLKRDKFAFFDKECSRVAEHIYLGSDAVAKNRETLRANGITHVLNCVGFVCPEYFPKELSYKTLWLQDNPGEDITSILYDVFDYFEEVRELGGRVFVHCCQGVSRSTSLVIAYLMWREGRSFEDAFQDVKAARGVTNPNMGFACQLLQCQKRVHAAPVSPNSMLRMYRMAPHSVHDPRHLVPKAVNHPGVEALDSRGAFVVHIPSALFVWQGRLCVADMASAGETAATQIVHYERAQGPIIRVTEGSESAEFWDALHKGPVKQAGEVPARTKVLKSEEGGHVCEQNTSKLRIVPAYDVDFEVFQRSKDGVVPQTPQSGPAALIPPRDSGWSRLRGRFRSGAGLRSKDKPQPEDSATIETKSQEIVLASKGEQQTKKANSTPGVSPDPSLASSHSPFSADSFSSSSSLSSSPSVMSPSPSFQGSPPSSESPHSVSPSSSHPWSPPPPQSPPSSSCPGHASSSENFSKQTNSKSPSPLQTGAKVPLAQRRGNLSLKFPVNSSDPPPAPRGLSRKPRLPPIVVSETSKPVDSLGKENGGPRHRALEISRSVALDGEPVATRNAVELEEPNPVQPWIECLSRSATPPPPSPQDLGSIESSTQEPVQYPWQNSLGKKQASKESIPSLYEWPRMEKIDMFDADDLDSKAAFVLVVPGSLQPEKVAESNGFLYVWAGRDWTSSDESNDVQTIDRELHQIGCTFIREMRLQRDLPVQVVKEGEETDDFWNYFVNG